MKKVFLIILMILGLGSLSAQSFVKQYNSGFNQNRSILSNDTLKILAVMVDFQEDKYDATIGTGKFGSHYTQAYGDTILDPLPHNANYFSDHLLFAKNYYQKVSRGKLNISYKVLPDVITVTKTMRDYVPAYQSKDFTPLANFASEVWKLADEKYSNIKFSDYNLFIIFHAGVSSGLDLGTFSIDRNLPSLYLGQSAFKKVYGDQFTGISTRSGKIINSIILPETESRELTAVDNSKILIQITINGALAANIASHLGLPDLFDTETGLSAIGRFGLMDGQAISANYGMFPPEPSPWEKMFLGWEQPLTLNINNSHPSIAARLTASTQDTTLLKVPINSSEYFLIENRQQDAKKNNVIITYRRNDTTFTKEVFKDTSGLFNVIPKSIRGGVVIDVDEYDAAVPGNGIVIWHIDEKIINDKLAENKINSNPNARGVYVEEADGIQDIGVKYTSYFGTFIGEGTKEDFWYAGNKAKLYKNIFAPDSKPNTKSNSGANSLITLNNFSTISNKMSFNVKYQSSNLNLLYRDKLEQLTSPSSLVVYKHASVGLVEKQYVSFKDNSDLFTFEIDGRFISRIFNFSDYDLAVGYDPEIKITTVIGVKDKMLTSAYVGYIWQKIVNLPSSASTGAVLQRFGNTTNVFIGTVDGNVVSVNYKYLLGQNVNEPIKTQKIINEPIKQIVAYQNKYSAISSTHFIDIEGNIIAFPDSMKMLAVVQNAAGKLTSVILSNTNTFYIVENGKISQSFLVKTSKNISGFSLADLKNNGNFKILINDGKYIEAYSFNGILEDNFPLVAKDESEFISLPITLDIDNDGYVEIIATTSNGNVYCFDGKNKNSILFFTSIGGRTVLSPILFNYDTNSNYSITKNVAALIGIDNNKLLNVLSLSADSLKNSWSTKYLNFTNNVFLNTSINSNAFSDFFPSSKAYNWPNPVYGSSTNIRYYVSEDSDVKIKIVDLAGELVAELNGKARGGFDNETVWDVSNIQSGIYYAYLEVKGISGNSANKIIKIAVVK
ncbi:MAG: T9SS type A sorting domain-containing protein [Melioribacteraceae bacterium]